MLKLFEQLPSHRCLVHALGHADGVQRPQPLAFRRQQREPERVEPVDERQVILLVPRVPRLETFLLDDSERFVQREPAAPRSCGDTRGAASNLRAARGRDRSCGGGRGASSARVEKVIGASPDGAPRPFCEQL